MSDDRNPDFFFGFIFGFLACLILTVIGHMTVGVP